MVRAENLGGKMRDILNEAIRTQKNQVQNITLRMGWKINNLNKIVAKHEVTESI